MPRCAFSATAEVSWVFTTYPSARTEVHEASGLRCPSTSTMHCRQAPTGSRRGWSQKRGIWIPRSSAARMISVPLGTLTSKAVDRGSDEFGLLLGCCGHTVAPVKRVDAS